MSVCVYIGMNTPDKCAERTNARVVHCQYALRSLDFERIVDTRVTCSEQSRVKSAMSRTTGGMREERTLCKRSAADDVDVRRHEPCHAFFADSL